MNKKLKTYYIEIDEEMLESGIDGIAITQTPAIELMAKRFNAQNENKDKWSFSNDKRIIAGPAIIADKEIYRKDADGKEYNVVFTADVIERMVEKFNSEASQRVLVFNFEHTERKVQAFVRANWIVEDSKLDKSQFYGFELSKGSWFIEAKVAAEDWQFIKEMEGVGFSIEGLMAALPLKEKEALSVELSETPKEITTIYHNKENKMKKIKLFAKYFEGNRGAVKTFNLETKLFVEVAATGVDEMLIVDELAVGSAVNMVDADGNTVGAADGEYEIAAEGIVIVVADGKIADMKEIEAEAEASEQVEEVMAEDDAAPAADAPDAPVEDERAVLLAKIDELEAKIEALEAKIDGAATEEEDFTATEKDVYTKISELRGVFNAEKRFISNSQN